VYYSLLPYVAVGIPKKRAARWRALANSETQLTPVVAAK
jgi:hypothetical protein